MHPGLSGFGLLNIMLVIICHCHGVSDRRILAEAGLGARCADEVAQRCGAGSDCGGCFEWIENVLEIRTTGIDDVAQLAS